MAGAASPRWSPLTYVAAASPALIDGDRLELSGVELTGPVPVRWRHRQAGPIGRVEVVDTRDDRWLLCRVRFDLSTPRGWLAWDTRRRGLPLHASVMYDVLRRDRDDARRVMRWQLIDVSIVQPGGGRDPGAVTPGWLK